MKIESISQRMFTNTILNLQNTNNVYYTHDCKKDVL